MFMQVCIIYLFRPGVELQYVTFEISTILVLKLYWVKSEGDNNKCLELEIKSSEC